MYVTSHQVSRVADCWSEKDGAEWSPEVLETSWMRRRMDSQQEPSRVGYKQPRP
jgi:hypothetical protein